jgi:phage I-like protein
VSTMTKTQAIEKVTKLLALAKGTANPNEKANAERRARDLMTKHGLSDADLKENGKAAAFDKLVDILGEYTSKHPDLQQNKFGAVPLISEVLNHSKGNLTNATKTVLLDKINSGLSMLTFVFGSSNQTLNDVKGIVDSIYKSFGI